MAFDVYSGSIVHSSLGSVAIKKLFGSGPISVGTQITLPHCSIDGLNPLNNQYYGGVNSDANLSGDNQGKRSPSCSFSTVVKTTSWFTSNLIESMILSIDANGNTDVWSILIDDGTNTGIWDGAKFMGLSLRQITEGGPIQISGGAVSMYGNSENTGNVFAATTFTSRSVDPGYITDTTQVTWGSTADLVREFQLDIARPQSPVYYDSLIDARYVQGVASGMLTGNLRLVQSTQYTETPGSSGTLNIGSTGAGVTFSILSKLDERRSPLNGGLRTITSSLSLYDSTSGGVPIACTAM